MIEGSVLPRSVRWRLQLGLLNVPNNVTTAFDSSNVAASLQSISRHNESRVKEQRERYDGLVNEQFTPFMQQLKHDEENEKKQDESQQQQQEESKPPQAAPIDPLTAMLMETQAKEKRREEIDLKYRKERARRKRGMASSGGHEEEDCEDEHSMNVQTRIMIEKDLNRLQPEHYSHHLARLNNSKSETTDQPNHEDTYDECVAERNSWLEQILLIHAMVHPQLGYRQGMHEIASYLLFVLEMDLLEQEEHQGDSECLLDGSKIVHDAYHMFGRIMNGLSGAYDVVSNHSSGNKTTPMEIMAKSILLRIRHVAQDEVLYSFLTKPTSVAPQLYCTKWVRLMFSREVTGWRNVLLLWDEFLNLTSCEKGVSSLRYNSNKSDGCAVVDLQTVLELTAASRIMLIRSQLLQHTNNVNESIHLLMNIEPLETITPLINALYKMTERLVDPSKERTPLLVAPPLRFVDTADRPTVPPATPAPSKKDGPLSASLNVLRDALLEQQPSAIAAQHLGESIWKSASNMMGPDNDKKEPASKAPTAPTGGTGRVVSDPLLGRTIPPSNRPQEANSTVAKGATPRQHPQASKRNGNDVSLKEMFSTSLKRLTTPTATDPLFGQHNSNTSMSKTHATTTRKSPTTSKSQQQHLSNHDLADKLHGCVLTIQQFLMKTTAASPITPPHDELQTPTKQHQDGVPQAVWEALAQIETVRMHLLQHPND